MTPTQAQIDAASKTARDELASISTWLVNYNNQISDDQLDTFIKAVLTAALNVAPPVTPPVKIVPPIKTPKKGKRK